MNNIDLIESLGKYTLQNIQFSEDYLNEEVVGEYDLYGGAIQFIKDSVKFLLKIKKLKENEEIVIDLIHPTGFCSIFKTKDEYELSLAIKGQKAITYKSKNPKDIIMKVIALLKDQATTGRKELKNARS